MRLLRPLRLVAASLILVASILGAAAARAETPTCAVVNWANSFNKAGWSYCAAGSVLGGYYKTNGNTLSNLAYGRCCRMPSAPTSYKQSSQAAPFLDQPRSGMALCSANMFITGLYRGASEALSSMSGAACGNASGAPIAAAACVNVDVSKVSGQANNWVMCPAGMAITGFIRGATDDLSGITGLHCCPISP